MKERKWLQAGEMMNPEQARQQVKNELEVAERALDSGMHGKNRTSRERVISYILCVVFVLFTSVMQILYADSELFLNAGMIEFSFYHLPSMLLSGLFGIVPAMISYLLVFSAEWFMEQQIVYSETIILLSDILIYIYVRGGRIKKPLKSVGFFALLSILVGPFWNTLLMLLDGRGYNDLGILNLVNFYITALPECLITVFILYVFLVHAPDGLKRITLSGIFYTKDYSGYFDRRNRSKISRQITALIILEGLVLGITAAVFANSLIPDIRDNVSMEAAPGFMGDLIMDNRDPEALPQYESSDAAGGEAIEETSGEDSGLTQENLSNMSEEELSDMAQNAESRARFVMNNKGLAFDLKLILLILSVAIPFTVLADFYAQRKIGVPITMMAQKIGELCQVPQEEKESKLKEVQRLPIANRDEIGDLYRSIGTMAGNITSFVDQVVREQKLEEDLRVAQKASETKSNFLNNMSHEIRTPINAVLGLDEMIIREAKDDDIRKYAVDIQNAGKTLLGLVNDILDSSKLEVGKMEILPVEYDLSSTVNDLINMISVKAKDKGLELIVNVDEDTPYLLYGDEIRIKQVITNVLTNAVKYTEKGSVTLNIGYEKTAEDKLDLKVSVVDTGIGIKEEDLSKLFSPFERIEEVRNRTIEGTGLGMSIVKQLLALMDTKLVVKSVYGQGSDFSFTVSQGVVKWDRIGNFSEMYERSKNSIAEYHESFRAPDALILITDDTEMNLTVAKALLKQTRGRIETATSGFETLDKIKEKKYDVIFLDHRMPEMDGIETLAKMLEDTNHPNTETPVIALTANAISGARETYLSAGFKDYLSKPIDGAKFEKMLESYLPEEKVLHQGDEGYGETDSPETGETDGGKESKTDAGGSQLRNLLKGSTMVDYDAAIAACGNEEVFEAALKDYLGAVPTKSQDIERFAANKDYRNYTVLVHALKSSSRLIGATALSLHAAELEAAGDEATAGSEEAMEKIAAETPDLLKVYRSYFDKLTPLINGDGDGDDMRPEITKEELLEAMNTIYEFAEAFDFDSADDVVEMLRDYQIPDRYADGVNTVIRKIAEVDQAALIESLDAVKADLV
ncbi:MAG: response regulator [Lachnospiraceae bacterium]|nr:response regulator [Lachnospiraceae bacterium]